MISDLYLILPEITLLSLACICLIVDLYATKHRMLTYIASQFSLITTAVLCVYYPKGSQYLAFMGQFAADPFAQLLKIFILILMFLVLLYSRVYIRERKIPFGEFHALCLFSTLGMMVLVSAKSMLMLFLGLELLTLPLYALVALHRESRTAQEAGMKYFVMGSLASGMLLYGISLLYGVTGSIAIDEIATVLKTIEGGKAQVCLVAMIFILAGLSFKLGIVPFHMWIPDIYQGAPTNVTLLVATAPKIAAFGMAYRLLHDTFAVQSLVWAKIMLVLAVLSIALGNIVAIVQSNLKRLLAYSTIAHVGFLFLALMVAPEIGYGTALYYIVVYTFVAACAFGVIVLLSHQGIECDKLSDMKGLAQRSPFLAFLMLLVAFSLAGVPPTVGFYAKFMVLTALVDAGFTWLAAFVVVFSIIGAYYYLKIVRTMYFDSPESPYAITGAKDMRLMLSINGLAILAMGIFPAPLYMLCQHVFIKMVP